MINTIKKLFEDKTIAKAPVEPFLLEKVTRVLIMLNKPSRADFNNISKLIKTYPRWDRQILLTKSDEATNNLPFAFTILNEEDFDWRKKVKNEDLKEIIGKPYDLYLNYSTTEDPLIELFERKVCTKLFVGRIPSKRAQLVLKTSTPDPQRFNQKLLETLPIINKK